MKKGVRAAEGARNKLLLFETWRVTKHTIGGVHKKYSTVNNAKHTPTPDDSSFFDCFLRGFRAKFNNFSAADPSP